MLQHCDQGRVFLGSGCARATNMKGRLLLSTLSLALAVAAHAQVTASIPNPPLCIGDCNGDGVVSVDELVTGIAMALGDNDVTGGCLAFCFDLSPDVACVVRAVQNALYGCPASCDTDQDCDAGNECVASRCTTSGCSYQCICD